MGVVETTRGTFRAARRLVEGVPHQVGVVLGLCSVSSAGGEAEVHGIVL